MGKVTWMWIIFTLSKHEQEKRNEKERKATKLFSPFLCEDEWDYGESTVCYIGRDMQG